MHDNVYRVYNVMALCKCAPKYQYNIAATHRSDRRFHVRADSSLLKDPNSSFESVKILCLSVKLINVGQFG